MRHYTRIQLRDTQCGCKGFRLGAGAPPRAFAMIDGFAFDVELFYLADQLGLSVKPLLSRGRTSPGSRCARS